MRNPNKIRAEFTELGRKLDNASPQARRSIVSQMGTLLDQFLEATGVHKADCSCDDCEQRVAEILIERSGTAGFDEYGHMGIQPT